MRCQAPRAALVVMGRVLVVVVCFTAGAPIATGVLTVSLIATASEFYEGDPYPSDPRIRPDHEHRDLYPRGAEGP